MRKVLIGIFLLAAILAGFQLYLKKNQSESGLTKVGISHQNSEQILSPFGKLVQQEQPIIPLSIFAKSNRINILLIGTDLSSERSAKGQIGFNTDSMILLSADTNTNKVLLTSVPRDLWINGNKINALYTIYGYDTLKDAFERITGQKVDGYIAIDFDAFKWLVNSFGGVKVTVPNTFTDSSFPDNSDTISTTVSFAQGTEVMDGDRALTYARSRKGNNGEGSDLMRAKRQHILLQGFVDSVSQPTSTFWPMDIKDFYEIATKQTTTNLTLDDAYYLWDFYKDKDRYTVESFVIGDEYIYHPGLYPDSPYQAWVFVPREENFDTLHKDIEDKLMGIYKENTLEAAEATNQEDLGSEPTESSSY